MNVYVRSGVVQIAGRTHTVTGGVLPVTTADGTNPRFDLIVVDDSGTPSAIVGAPAEHPVFPLIPDDSVVLAAVYVPPAVTEITTPFVIDKRVMVPRQDFLDMREISDPGPPHVNSGRLYFEDDGAGKTRLVVRFHTGTAQVIKTEA